MKAHALYEEVHNFLKGKAPLFERELALIRNNDHLHHGDPFLGSASNHNNNSRKSSARAVVHAVMKQQRSSSREAHTNNGANRQDESVNQIGEVREDTEETVVETEDP